MDVVRDIAIVLAVAAVVLEYITVKRNSWLANRITLACFPVASTAGILFGVAHHAILTSSDTLPNTIALYVGAPIILLFTTFTAAFSAVQEQRKKALLATSVQKNQCRTQ